MIRWLKRFFFCDILWDHDWTYRIQQGYSPTQDDLNSGPIEQVFHDWCRMWCRRCGHFSELNRDKSTAPIPGCEPWNINP